MKITLLEPLGIPADFLIVALRPFGRLRDRTFSYIVVQR